MFAASSRKSFQCFYEIIEKLRFVQVAVRKVRVQRSTKIGKGNVRSDCLVSLTIPLSLLDFAARSYRHFIVNSSFFVFWVFGRRLDGDLNKSKRN